MKVCYVLDIGVYNLGNQGQVLKSTTAAWARVAAGTGSFDSIEYSGLPASGTLAQAENQWECGRDVELLAKRVSNDLAAGHFVALGFEAPMWFPTAVASTNAMQLFGPRFEAERGSEWYLQSGAAATVKALSLGTLLFSRLLASNHVRLTTDPAAAAQQTIVLFEAFVVGGFKQPPPHGVGAANTNEWDAFCAGLAWGSLHSAIAVPESVSPTRLHFSGGSSRRAASVWRMLAGTVETFPKIEGPSDCEVVALASKETRTAG